MDQLKRLGIEFDLADSAAALLDVEARAGPRGAIMVAPDPSGKPPDLGNRAEVQAFAPDEGADRGQECLARRDVARTGAGADKGGTLPGQR